MLDYIKLLKNQCLSGDLSESVKAIDKLLEINNDISNIILDTLKTSIDRFIICERINPFFDNYISKLEANLYLEDVDLMFWSSTLIVSHQIKNEKSEKILLTAVTRGGINEATTATTILSRVKDKRVKNAICERLKDNSLSSDYRSFFEEKLKDLNTKNSNNTL